MKQLLIALAAILLSANIAHVLTTVRGKGYDRDIMLSALRVCRERLGCRRIVVKPDI